MTRSLFFLLFLFSAQLSIAQSDSALMFIDKGIVAGGEDMVTMPDGVEARLKTIAKSNNTMVPIDKNTPAGTYKVYVKFIISKDGSLSDVQCDNDPGFGMCQQALRIVKKSKNWTPAEKNGKLINRYGKQLFTFLVNDKNILYTTKEPYTLYAGEENTLGIKVNDLKDKKIKVAVSDGTITKQSDGRYIIKVNKPGKVVLSVFKRSSKRKSIGTANFEVLAPKTNL